MQGERLVPIELDKQVLPHAINALDTPSLQALGEGTRLPRVNKPRIAHARAADRAPHHALCQLAPNRLDLG